MVDWQQDLFWSIDPGETKCGVAIFQEGRCVQALKSVPEECLDKLWEHTGYDLDSPSRPAGVVLEAFNLRADLAAMQRGSEMGTSQMIGAIRWICRHHGIPLVMQTPSQAHTMRKEEPFKDWPLRTWVSYGQGKDAQMAELHGYFRVSTSATNDQRRRWQRALTPPPVSAPRPRD